MQRPVAIKLGKSAGPTGWPGIFGNPFTAKSTKAPNAKKNSPNRVSWIFMVLFDQADCFHGGAQFGI
mgnify:CR=1 FL=1